MKVERKVSNSMVKTPATPIQDNKALAKEWYDKGLAEETDMNKKINMSKAIQLDPNYAQPYYTRGWAKGQLGNYSEAIADYDKAIQLDPTLNDAYHNRGAPEAAQLGKYIESIADYDKAIQLDPKYAKAYNNRGVSKKRIR